MPFYEYCCDKCFHTFELKQKFTDEPVASCPKCNGNTRRVISPAPAIFKGSGFYITDVKRKESSHTGPEARPYKKPETDSEKKPEAESSKDTSKDSSKGSAKEPAKPS